MHFGAKGKRFLIRCTLFFILTATSCSTQSEICYQAGINFTKVLSSIEPTEGHAASIPCQFNYTDYTQNVTDAQLPPQPFWRMELNNVQKSTFDLFPGILPSNYYFDETRSTLIIISVDRSLDNANITCCFDIFRLNGICESEKTFIHVLPNSQTTINSSVPIAVSFDFVMLQIMLMTAIVTII